MSKLVMVKSRKGISLRKSVTKRAVVSMIQSRLEPKAITVSTVANTSTAGVVYYMNVIPQDDTVSGRTGVQIRPKSLMFRVAVFGAGNFVTRYILLQDRMNNGSAPAVLDVLTTADVCAHYNINNQLNHRFKILDDTVLCVSNTGEQQRYKTHTTSLKGIIGFVGTGSTSASGGTNSIFLLAIGDSATPAFNHRVQLHYTDA